MLNTVPVKPAVRQPRGAVKLNGTLVPFLAWSADANSFYQADTFRCALALGAMPSGFGGDFFGSAGKIEVELFAGFPADPDNFSADELQSIFFGRADDVSFNPIRNVVELTGRDLTGLLIDNKTSEKFTNQTASQIATSMAQKYGLTPVVTSTSERAGRQYQIDHVRLQNEQTVWDLLTWLARQQDFVVYVTGHELHFEPRPDPGKDPYLLQWVPAQPGQPSTFNGSTLLMSRSLTLAKDIRVEVKSWHGKSKKAYVRTATRTGKGSGDVQKYSYVIPGLDPDQAQQRAQSILEELSRHEMKFSLDGPADNSLGKADVIKLAGTGTPWDQVYYPASLSRTMEPATGYSWRIEGKNHSTDAEPTL